MNIEDIDVRPLEIKVNIFILKIACFWSQAENICLVIDGVLLEYPGSYLSTWYKKRNFKIKADLIRNFIFYHTCYSNNQVFSHAFELAIRIICPHFAHLPQLRHTFV